MVDAGDFVEGGVDEGLEVAGKEGIRILMTTKMFNHESGAFWHVILNLRRKPVNSSQKTKHINFVLLSPRHFILAVSHIQMAEL